MRRPSAVAGVGCAMILLAAAALAAHAQEPAGKSEVRPASEMNELGMQPVMDNTVFTHALLEQFEDRWNGRDHQFRYDGQAWSGTDLNKVWLKSEGLVTSRGRFEDGQHELLYDRAITSYFDFQTGIRVDADRGPTRTFGALGVQGLSPYFFDVEATAYVSDQGQFATRLKASYDLLITQRLILQPEAELNLYSKSDRARGTGAGLSDIDSGLRLRYEITRKFAPYIGVSYAGRYFKSADYARREGESTGDVRFTFGLRTWF